MIECNSKVERCFDTLLQALNLLRQRWKDGKQEQWGADLDSCDNGCTSNNRVHGGVGHGCMPPPAPYCHIELCCSSHDGPCEIEAAGDIRAAFCATSTGVHCLQTSF